MIPGYETSTPLAFWQRLKQYKVLHKWFAVWLALAAVQVGFLFRYVHLWWVHQVVLAAVLVGGELCLLRWITVADQDWDNLFFHQDLHTYEAD